MMDTIQTETIAPPELTPLLQAKLRVSQAQEALDLATDVESYDLRAKELQEAEKAYSLLSNRLRSEALARELAARQDSEEQFQARLAKVKELQTEAEKEELRIFELLNKFFGGFYAQFERLAEIHETLDQLNRFGPVLGHAAEPNPKRYVLDCGSRDDTFSGQIAGVFERYATHWQVIEERRKAGQPAPAKPDLEIFKRARTPAITPDGRIVGVW